MEENVWVIKSLKSNNKMEKKLAIRGHITRGKEVIEIFLMLGGKNFYNLNGGIDDEYYYIDNNGFINSGLNYIENWEEKFTPFILEEFLKKFPYKIGDKVNSPCKGCVKTITSMEWDSYLNTVTYKLDDKIYTNINQLEIVNNLPTIPTYNEWITFEEGCELPNEWEGVIVAAPQHKSKTMHCVYINGQFHTLGIRDQVIIPKKFMRIDVSNITMKDAYTYGKKVSKK